MLFILLLFYCALGQTLNDTVSSGRYGVPESNEPVHFHLAFAGDGMAVMWETDNDTATHICNYGVVSGQLTNTQTGASQTYGTVYAHLVILPKLAANTRYYYSCGDKTSGFSEEFSFVSALSSADKSSYSVAVIGDMGIKQSNGVASSMIKHLDTYDFVLHIGDLGYADDYYLYLSTYEQVYSDWFDEIEPISANVAFMGLPGNHEATCNEALPILCEDYLKNFTAYRTRWRFPSAESKGTSNMWYSFDYGLVHWVQISTETDFLDAPEGPTTRLASGPFGDQMTWLSNDLAAAVANRGSVPWIIVSGHRPIWYSNKWKDDKSVRDAFLPILQKYNVDIFFAGHEHNYERYFPINNNGQACQTNYTDSPCPIFIVNGAGGNVEGHQRGRGSPDYLAFRDTSNYGWARFTVVNYTTLTWEFITDQDVTVDACTIVKNLKY